MYVCLTSTKGSNASLDWYLWLFLGDCNVQLAVVKRTNGLLPGAQYNVTARVFVPHAIYGNYFILVQTDSRNNIYEHTDEDNNVVPGKVIHCTEHDGGFLHIALWRKRNVLFGFKKTTTKKQQHYICRFEVLSQNFNWYIKLEHLSICLDIVLTLKDNVAIEFSKSTKISVNLDCMSMHAVSIVGSIGGADLTNCRLTWVIYNRYITYLFVKSILHVKYK